MELRHLRYFIAVAEELNFSRAAARLNMAQPPLSSQIRHLEHMLGFPLFVRDKHHVELTSAGKVYLIKAREILGLVAQAHQEAELYHQGARGSIAIGFVGSTTYQIVPVLQAYRRRHPDMHVTLHQMKSSDQLQALYDKKLDIGVVRGAFQNPNIHCDAIGQEPFVAVLPENHPLAAQSQLALPALRGEKFILTPFRSESRYLEAVTACCLDAGFRPQVALEAPEILTIVAFVAGGIGISLVPESFMNLHCQGAVYRPLIPPPAPWQISVIYNDEDKVHQFIKEIWQQGQPPVALTNP